IWLRATALSRSSRNVCMCRSTVSAASAESLFATSDCSSKILRRTLGWRKSLSSLATPGEGELDRDDHHATSPQSLAFRASPRTARAFSSERHHAAVGCAEDDREGVEFAKAAHEDYSAIFQFCPTRSLPNDRCRSCFTSLKPAAS